MNQVVLTGNLTRDPELKHSASGGSYTRFTIAVSREYKKDETDFISCTAFNKTAEIIGEYTAKGSKIGVIGRLQQDTYEKDGKKQSKTGVIVDRVEFLSKSENKGNKSEPTEMDNDDSFPFS